MDWLHIIQLAGAFIILLSAVGAGFGALWYAFRSKQLKELKEEVETNKRLLDQCEEKHKKNEKRIQDLEAKIDHTINIPLSEIAEHMKTNNEISKKLLANIGENK